MGGVVFKPRRAKCHECGNGMLQKNGIQKYCMSCRRIVRLRQAYEFKVRTGRIKNPGGTTKFKPRRAKCHECGNGMIQKHGASKYCASCKRTVRTRTTYEHRVRTGLIKNPGIGTARPMNRGPKPRREDSNNWKGGGRSWQTREFRGKECERCSSGGQMHLHHKDLDVSNWKPENLETLCPPCHNKEHPGGAHAAA